MRTAEYLRMIANMINDLEDNNNYSECIRISGVVIEAMQSYQNKVRNRMEEEDASKEKPHS